MIKVFIDSVFEEYYYQYPLVLVDVGARGGLQKHWLPAQNHLQVIAFEPDPEEYIRLIANKKIRYLNTALYNQRTTLDLYLTREPGRSSVMRPVRNFLDRFPKSCLWDVVKTLQIEVDTLDNQLCSNEIYDIDFVKLDTQGSELFILEGARHSLEHALGLEIEVEFDELYEKQPLFADVDKLVRQLGFVLFDLRPQFLKREFGKNYGGIKGQLLHGDALYLRSIESLINLLNQIDNIQLKKAKTLHAISICVLYGYLDYALEIFGVTSSLFTQSEINIFMKELKKEFRWSNSLSNYIGGNVLWYGLAPLYKIYNRLYINDGATSSRYLGNKT